MDKKVIKEYDLIIEPAIDPAHRHKIEDLLDSMGYTVQCSGTRIDMSMCDIKFIDEK